MRILPGLLDVLLLHRAWTARRSPPALGRAWTAVDARRCGSELSVIDPRPLVDLLCSRLFALGRTFGLFDRCLQRPAGKDGLEGSSRLDGLGRWRS
jgi:hypothetical protein